MGVILVNRSLRILGRTFGWCEGSLQYGDAFGHNQSDKEDIIRNMSPKTTQNWIISPKYSPRSCYDWNSIWRFWRIFLSTCFLLKSSIKFLCSIVFVFHRQWAILFCLVYFYQSLHCSYFNMVMEKLFEAYQKYSYFLVTGPTLVLWWTLNSRKEVLKPLVFKLLHILTFRCIIFNVVVYVVVDLVLVLVINSRGNL